MHVSASHYLTSAACDANTCTVEAMKLMQCGTQESLGGNAKTSLVIAVANAEEHVDESLQSLQFGSRAMRILTRAVVNERTDVKADISPEVLAQLEQTEDQANALALSLLAKENELEQMQGDLQVSMHQCNII